MKVVKTMMMGLLLTLGSYVQADTFMLTMSKAPAVCQHMYKLFNDDLVQKRKLDLQSHKEFSSIKWDKKLNFGPRTPWYKNAFFDINNDGKDEIVSFSAKRFDMKFKDDSLAYLPMKMKQRMTSSEEITWTEIHQNHLYLAETGSTYLLKDYPIQMMFRPLPDEEMEADIPHFYVPFIRPFLFDGKYYIALIGNTINTTRRTDTINDKDSIVIQEFMPDNKTKDLCYYVKVINTRTEIDAIDEVTLQHILEREENGEDLDNLLKELHKEKDNGTK